MPDCTGAQTSSTSREVMFTAIDKTQLQNEPAAVPPPADWQLLSFLPTLLPTEKLYASCTDQIGCENPRPKEGRPNGHGAASDDSELA